MHRTTRNAVLVLVLIALNALAGCKSLPIGGNESRQLETSLRQGESIGLHVESYGAVVMEKAGETAKPLTESADDKAQLQLCLTEELERANSEGIFFRIHAPAAAPTEDVPAYRITVNAKRENSARRLLILPLLIVNAFGSMRYEELQITAAIHRADGTQAGTVSVFSKGTATSAFTATVFGGDFKHEYLDEAGVCKELAARIKLFLTSNAKPRSLPDQIEKMTPINRNKYERSF